MPADALSSARFGWTGKLPAHGDFVLGGAFTDLLAGLRGWLDAGMAAAEIGDPDRFLTGRFARIAAADGFLGPTGGFVLIGPGMDSVGRLFPFALALRAPAPPVSAEALALPVWAEMEAAFLAALGEGRGADGLARFPEARLPVGGPAEGALLIRDGDAAPTPLEAPARPEHLRLALDGLAPRGADVGHEGSQGGTDCGAAP